ncbi:DUF4132 domain-containing protein [Streptomyces rubellomurinus]|uniref:DUF4132 domain-containing protein n=1 Tax=Streptomyces rubellomurinus (strain ATCC 31215) TaxID=359131 RepID=UPI000698C21B|nr:DUF4132 domain-containing protein [Streptomyces rubellomurinus]
MTTTTDPDLLGPALGGLLDALDSGHVGEMARALVEADAALGGDWSGERAAPARERVRELHGNTRTALAADLVGRMMMCWRPVMVERLRQERSDLVRLAALVSLGFPPGPARPLREDWLHLQGRQWRLAELPDAEALIAEELAAGRPLDGALVAAIRRTALSIRPHHSAVVDLAAGLTEPLVNPGEAWADQALADVAELDGERGPGGPWTALLRHATEAKSAKPTARWEKTGRALLDAVGPERARERITAWLSLVGRPRTLDLLPGLHDEAPHQLDPYNFDALRGLALLLPLTLARPDSARVLARLVGSALRKAPGIGPQAPKVANAAVHALARLDGEDGLAQLAVLSTRVTYKGTVKELDKALRDRAAALGLGRAEIEELAVPAYGLTEPGRRVEQFGAARVELLVEGTRVRQTWYNEAGRPVKTPPAAVRREHADGLKEFKAEVKDLEKMLTAQSERLDRQFLARRSWRYGPWRQRLLDHPLVGTLARRLIWTVDGTACAWLDGALRTAAGEELAPAADAPVELWHPVACPPESVLAWRAVLERHEVVQPFKQAHREVYLLTAAEERTRVYSNRFAAHVLRQRRFHALAAVRGWHGQLHLAVDNSFPAPKRLLPEWGLRAEFWVNGTDADWGEAFAHLGTDQVRFYPIDAPENLTQAGGGAYGPVVRPGLQLVEPVPLADVPPLVLSEVLRDVDLFVGVTSVGNDPTWSDGGPQGRYRDYWHAYGFGELSQSARERGELLARLLPRLAVGGRCRVDGRFLEVRGELRTYRIHLGSGNVLMAPDDTYLCIVPGSDEPAAGRSYLPFEGDGMLAIVLSKAVLLANDTAITDPSITSQLARR